MLKKNKLKIIISSVITVLPILFGVIMWNDLPNNMATHFASGGEAASFSGKAFAVFGLPLILLAVHFICLFFTTLDKNQQDQNPKALGIIFWIIPVLSVFVNTVIYATAFGKEINLSLFTPLVLGVAMVFMGNFLPKTKYNRTLGFKLSWTLKNEENWNKTHRFGGKVMVVCGFLLMLSVLLPLKAMLTTMLIIIFAMVLLPIVYSYSVYVKHKKQGITYNSRPATKAENVAYRISLIVVAVILIGIVIMMFTGKIEAECKDTALSINATYWVDISVDYSDIDSIEYRKNLDLGVRTNGWISAKLLLGIFENEEFDLYTLYSYANANEFVVITSNEKTLVIGMSDPKDTKAIYDTVLSETKQ